MSIVLWQLDPGVGFTAGVNLFKTYGDRDLVIFTRQGAGWSPADLLTSGGAVSALAECLHEVCQVYFIEGTSVSTVLLLPFGRRCNVFAWLSGVKVVILSSDFRVL